MSKKKGFTLIELLVVIAIIALLVAILMPSLAKARDLAKQASCMSNLKNLGSMFQMYTSEYNSFPHTWWGGHCSYCAALWSARGSLYSYVTYMDMLSYVAGGDRPTAGTPRAPSLSGDPNGGYAYLVSKSLQGLLICPADFGNFGAGDFLMSRPNKYTVSYAESMVLCAYHPGTDPNTTAYWNYATTTVKKTITQFATDAPAKADNIPLPSNTLQLLEGMAFQLWPTALNIGTIAGHTLWVRHPGGLTTNFVDGHAEARPKPAYNRGQLWGVDDVKSPFPNDQ